MILRELLEIDTPCDEGMALIEKWKMHDWELADCWDLIKVENPVFLGWGVKHAPMSQEKVQALRIIKDLGVGEPGKEWMNKDAKIAEMCFGWMKNPFVRG